MREAIAKVDVPNDSESQIQNSETSDTLVLFK